MFFNQYDIVEYGGVNYLILAVENETLIVYDMAKLKSVEIAKADCKRVKTMSDIRTNAIYESSMGTIEKFKRVPTVMSFLSKCPWIENASMNHRTNSWFYEAISVMESRNKLKVDTAVNLHKEISKLKPGNKTNFAISGFYIDGDVTIKLSLINVNGVVSVNNVKRIFGDDGIFGNIAKQSVTRKTNVPVNDPKCAISNNQKSRIAS